MTRAEEAAGRLRRASRPAAGALDWGAAASALRRPCPVPWTLPLLMGLVPVYLFIPGLSPREPTAPELALDGLVPVVPAWSLVYGALYGFLIVLPWLVVREPAHLRATLRAYLAIWITAYVVFFWYPTSAPRPERVVGDGFDAWGLRALYDSDPPYNCFPSLHVAHSFVSAVTVRLVHRAVGAVAIAFAALVALSTLFTKQHWVADVAGGIALAAVACLVFLRRPAPSAPWDADGRHAPPLAVALGALSALAVAGFWAIYRLLP